MLNHAENTFVETCATIRRITHGDILMPAGFYLEQIEAGRIGASDLQQALDQSSEITADHHMATLNFETF